MQIVENQLILLPKTFARFRSLKIKRYILDLIRGTARITGCIIW